MLISVIQVLRDCFLQLKAFQNEEEEDGDGIIIVLYSVWNAKKLLTLFKDHYQFNYNPRKRSLEGIPPQTKFGGVYRNHPVCLFLCPSVCLSRVNLTLAITFEPKEIGISYYTCVLLVARPWPWLLKKLNLGHNFWTKGDKTFIVHMCITCGSLRKIVQARCPRLVKFGPDR